MWVTDFRDPWTDRFYYYENPRNSFISFFDKCLEKKVLKECDYLVTVSDGFFSLLNNNCNIANKAEIIYNGYDIDDFKDYKKNKVSNNNIIISNSVFFYVKICSIRKLGHTLNNNTFGIFA